MTTTDLLLLCVLTDDLCQLPQPREHVLDQEVIRDV